MTNLIQIIGLPGSGKTTQILKYLKNTLIDIDYIDIRNFAGTYREQKFRRHIIKSPKCLIAESACGIQNTGYVIKIDTPIQQVYSQLLMRDSLLDEDYLSLLGTQMVAADCTLNRPGDLPGLLKTIFEGQQCLTSEPFKFHLKS